MSVCGVVHILIIEDDQTLLKILCLFFEDEGFKAVCANTAQQGLFLAKTHRPSLIVCDLHLPDATGMEVACAVKADPELAGISMIAITGDIAPETELQAKASGFDVFMVKPFKLDDLAGRVARIERKLSALERG